LMYSYLNAAVKHALSRYNIAPSLDFSLNPEITQLPSVSLPQTDTDRSSVEKGYLFNSFSQRNQAHFIDKNDGLQRWKELYEIAQKPASGSSSVPDFSFSEGHQEAAVTIPALHSETETAAAGNQNILIVQGSMLVTTVKSGLMVINIR